MGTSLVELGSGSLTWPQLWAWQAHSPRKSPSHAATSGEKGKQLGAWDKAASFSLLVLRLQTPGGRRPKSHLYYPGT